MCLPVRFLFRVNLFVSYFSMYLQRNEYLECKVYCLAQNPEKKVLPRSRNANRKVLNRWNVIADGIARTDRAHRGSTLFLFSSFHFSLFLFLPRERARNLYTGFYWEERDGRLEWRRDKGSIYNAIRSYPPNDFLRIPRNKVPHCRR